MQSGYQIAESNVPGDIEGDPSDRVQVAQAPSEAVTGGRVEDTRADTKDWRDETLEMT